MSETVPPNTPETTWRELEPQEAISAFSHTIVDVIAPPLSTAPGFVELIEAGVDNPEIAKMNPPKIIRESVSEGLRNLNSLVRAMDLVQAKKPVPVTTLGGRIIINLKSLEKEWDKDQHSPT